MTTSQAFIYKDGKSELVNETDTKKRYADGWKDHPQPQKAAAKLIPVDEAEDYQGQIDALTTQLAEAQAASDEADIEAAAARNALAVRINDLEPVPEPITEPVIEPTPEPEPEPITEPAPEPEPTE